MKGVLLGFSFEATVLLHFSHDYRKNFLLIKAHGPKMFFYFKEANSFQIFAEESSDRAESNNIASVSSWIQKG